MRAGIFWLWEVDKGYKIGTLARDGLRLSNKNLLRLTDDFRLILNTLLPDVPLLYPLKASENRRFSDVFMGYKKGTPGSNGLILFSEILFSHLWKTNQVLGHLLPIPRYL